MNQEERKTAIRRMRVLVAAACILMLLYGLRLIFLQLVNGYDFKSQATNTTDYKFTVTAARGDIVDSRGERIATSVTGYNVVLNKLLMGDEDLDGMLQKIVELLRANGESWNDTLLISQPDAAGNYTFTAEEGSTRDQKALAAMKDNLGLQQYATANDVMEKLVEDYDLASYPLSWQRTLGGIHYEMQLQAFSNVNNFIMAENVSEATVATIKEHSLSLPGVEIVETSTRSYEQSTVLPHVLGRVGKITAEKWKVTDENGQTTYPLREKGYNMNDIIGISGLESAYEDELRGKDGVETITRNSDGVIVDTALTTVPEPGHTVQLTIDSRFQKAVDKALAENIDMINRVYNTGSMKAAAGAAVPTISRGRVTFVDAALPQGVVVPDANLAVFSIADLNARMDANRARSRRKVDITQITFPFKPGDYVVHATHGIALFSEIARQEVGGKERDYFLLEYADGDKLYVPLEQVDRITRYVGPDGDKPRLTRLNTADWTRATNKARKNAKKLAFDLVDLYTRRSSITGIACPPDTPEQIEMEQSFPYDETRDQLEAIADIKADMEAPKPMDRLLCGDVGFGKTEVALRAAFKCVDSGRQVMVLCPTTILAQQHYETFFERFAPFGLEVEVLSRFRTPAQQKRALKAFAEGTIDVLIGTHRLLSADVNPKNLGLVIIDEEQRFGVQHKEQLKNLREQIDVLTLSATPIPRTMQMATSGVRDMSLITTPPTGRRPVIVHVGEYDPDVVSAAIRLEVGRGGQVYYVSNRVKTIDDAVARVHEAAPEARVGVAHGKMSPREVEDVMIEFATKKIDVLIATTIVESGIDNATANTLIIEDSQRLGLAQLYQLKGRVGRSATQAYAYFMFPGELPLTEEATARLTALSEFQDLGSGMRIAMRDLEIRGAGSLMGAEQHGNLSSVGFDLFTQMLGQAVAEARGDDDAGVEAASVGINLPADYFLSEEYLPAVDQRVLVYRKLAAAEDLESIDEVQEETEAAHGELPLAGLNLFNRARIRIRGERLGLESVTLSGGRITFLGVDVPKKVAFEFKNRYGAVNFPKSRKLSVPYKAGAGAGSGLGRGLDANDGTGPVAAALMLLQQLGASDDD